MIVEPRPDHLALQRPQFDHSSLPVRSLNRAAAPVPHEVPPRRGTGASSPPATNGPSSMVAGGPAGPALAKHHRDTAAPVQGPAVIAPRAA